MATAFNGKTYLDSSGLSFLIEKIAALYNNVVELDSTTSSNLSSLISAIYTATSSDGFDSENGSGYLVDVYNTLSEAISALSDTIGDTDDSSADSTVYAAINELSETLASLKTSIETLLGTSSTSDDTTIYGLIAAETEARESADSDLQSNIDAETSARETADSELQEQIDKITTDAITAVESTYDYDKEILSITYTRGLSESSDETSKTSTVEISLANLVVHGILEGSVLVTVTESSDSSTTAVDASGTAYSTESVTGASEGDKYLILSFGTHSVSSSDASTGSDEEGSSIIWINLTDLVDLYEFGAVSSNEDYITLVATTADDSGTNTTTYTVALTDLAEEDFKLVEGNGEDDSGNAIRGIVSLDSDLTDVESWIDSSVITEDDIDTIILDLNATYDGFAEATDTSASSSSSSTSSES